MAEIIQTLKPAGGGDYTLMAVAESTAQGLYGDLVAGGNNYVLECYTGTTNESVSWAGWITATGNGITIRAAVGEEHGGVIGAGYRISDLQTSGTLGVLTFNDSDVLLQGITANNRSTGSGSTVNCCVLLGTWRQSFDSVIFESDATVNTNGSLAGAAVTNNASVNNALFENCLFYGSAQGIRNIGQYGGWTVNSNTYVSANTARSSFMVFGSNALEACEVNNNVGYGPSSAGGDCFHANVNPTAGSGGNASFDASASGDDPQINITTADFSNYAGGDYSPAVGGKLDGTGYDLSGDFTTDITGATRTVPWTIGAYIVSGAPPVGIQEMYVNIGGTFTKATPSVLVGGVWKPADAYVLVAGVWKPVYER